MAISTPTAMTTEPVRHAPPALALRDVRQAFAPRRGSDDRPLIALDGFTLEVAPREIVAVIGPNGCGKSTLLRVADGLLTPAAGTVEVEGRPVVGPDAAIGFVFQEPRLLPWRSVLDNVAYPLELAGRPEAERRARASDLVALVGLTAFAGARPHELSGGMRQRVAIARALALRPSILLLDEPFSALDALTRERFGLELLRVWDRTATTIVVVTHSIPEAVFLADRVAVMSARPGRIVAEVPSPLARPRSLADLAAPEAVIAAEAIRAALGPNPGERDTDPVPAEVER